MDELNQRHGHSWKQGTRLGSDVRETGSDTFPDPVNCVCGATAWRYMWGPSIQITDIRQATAP